MKFLTTLLFSAMFITQSWSQTEWKQEKSEKGITIYTRKMTDSKLKEYKGTVVMTTTIPKLVALFKDITKHDKFIYKAKAGSVKMTKKISDNDFYTYMIISVPLVSDRDVVTHYKIGAPDAKGAVTIELEGAADLVPKVDGLVRVPKMKGYWKFEPMEGGKVKVTHQAYSSPGGNVSDSMANTSAVDAPFTMLEKLMALVK